VSENGIATDPEKVRTVVEWPVPRSLRELRTFLGLARYCRHFVKDFALLAAPMYALLKHGNKFCWTYEAQQSFNGIPRHQFWPCLLILASLFWIQMHLTVQLMLYFHRSN